MQPRGINQVTSERLAISESRPDSFSQASRYTAHFTGIGAPVAPGEPPTTATRLRERRVRFLCRLRHGPDLPLVPGGRPMPPVTVRVVARGPVKSKGPEAINRQLDTFKAAIGRSGAAVEEAFVPVLGTRLARPLHLQRILPDRGRIPVRAGRRAARGIPGGRGGRLHLADRRPGLARLVGHAEARTLGRGLSPIRPAAHRCRQPRARRHSRGKRALSFVLGQLARPAHP